MNTPTSNQFQKRVIALIYDFDGTLCPDAMQNHGLLELLGSNVSFWDEVKSFRSEYKSVEILTYMQLLMKKFDETQPDWKIKLQELGSKIPLFDGVEDWFDNINNLVNTLSKDRIAVRHYVISSGLEEMIAGNIVSSKTEKVFASSYLWKNGIPSGIARAITDASKPQYLFRINKGKEDYLEDINDHMSEDERPIPFSHMIFLVMAKRIFLA